MTPRKPTEKATDGVSAVPATPNERKELEVTGRMERKADLELTVAIASAGLGAGEVGS